MKYNLSFYKPIKEADWTMINRIFKAIPIIIACAAVGIAGARFQMEQYRYTNYIDSDTINMAKDMQAICDVSKVCNRADIIKRASIIGNEGAIPVANTNEDPSLGKP